MIDFFEIPKWLKVQKEMESMDEQEQFSRKTYLIFISFHLTPQTIILLLQIILLLYRTFPHPFPRCLLFIRNVHFIIRSLNHRFFIQMNVFYLL